MAFKEINSAKQQLVPTISAYLKSWEMIELVYKSDEQKTQLVVWYKDDWKILDYFDYNGKRLLPYSANNNLIQH